MQAILNKLVDALNMEINQLEQIIQVENIQSRDN